MYISTIVAKEPTTEEIDNLIIISKEWVTKVAGETSAALEEVVKEDSPTSLMALSGVTRTNPSTSH